MQYIFREGPPGSWSAVDYVKSCYVIGYGLVGWFAPAKIERNYANKQKHC